jgi:hypothetical protein
MRARESLIRGDRLRNSIQFLSVPRPPLPAAKKAIVVTRPVLAFRHEQRQPLSSSDSDLHFDRVATFPSKTLGRFRRLQKTVAVRNPRVQPLAQKCASVVRVNKFPLSAPFLQKFGKFCDAAV